MSRSQPTAGGIVALFDASDDTVPRVAVLGLAMTQERVEALRQALAAHGKAGDFYDGKRMAARYFFHYELPKTIPQFDLLDSGERISTDLDENWF